MTIREAKPGDLQALLALYAQLHDEPPPKVARAENVFADILADPRQHLLVAEHAGALVASCTVVIVPNLTRSARPYALIENVVTHRDFRRRGLLWPFCKKQPILL